MAMQKEKIPSTILSIVFILLVLEFFLNVPEPVKAINTDIRNFGSIIAAFAMMLGSANIFRVYGNRIRKKSENWEYAVLLLAVFLVTVFFGLMEGTKGTTFLWIYNYIQVPIGATVFSLLGFFIVYAAFRAFRAKTWEAGVLLVCGAAMIWWGAPLGKAIFPGIDAIATWLVDVPNAAAFRGYGMTTAIATVVIGLTLFMQKMSAFERMKEAAGGEA